LIVLPQSMHWELSEARLGAASNAGA
jgi:hypothetical protein